MTRIITKLSKKKIIFDSYKYGFFVCFFKFFFFFFFFTEIHMLVTSNAYILTCAQVDRVKSALKFDINSQLWPVLIRVYRYVSGNRHQHCNVYLRLDLAPLISAKVFNLIIHLVRFTLFSWKKILYPIYQKC